MSGSNGATKTAPGKEGFVGDGTVGGLLKFLDWLVSKGLASATAITPLKSASRQVFEIVEGTEEIDEIDVHSLNVEEYLDRFQVKAIGSGRLKPESITAYRSRFTRAVDYYTTYLASGEVPKPRLRGGGASSSRKRQAAVRNDAAASPAVTPAATSETTESEGKQMVTYPFPLESGEIANVRLPLRLPRADAERLAAFIRTLVFEPQKELLAAPEPETQG